MNAENRYSFKTDWSQEDQEFVGKCAEFPSLSHLDGDRVLAFNGIVELVQKIVADMEADGETPPVPFADRRYSGEFMTRVQSELHRRLVIEAAEADISLNRLVSFKLALPVPTGRKSPGRKRPAAGEVAT
jgi:predicted HicB family RNase H-like nuclease